jgi:uncharacterized membrane protein
MPARAALNVVYALKVKEMDAKERVDEKANKALWQGTPAHARPDTGGGGQS